MATPATITRIGHIAISGKPSTQGRSYQLPSAARGVQLQLKALATGSVVDALSADDVCSVVVPYEDTAVARELGER